MTTNRLTDRTCIVEFSDFTRRWSVRSTWLGWHRVLIFGLCLNVTAPAVTVLLGGWNVAAGRLIQVSREQVRIGE